MSENDTTKPVPFGTTTTIEEGPLEALPFEDMSKTEQIAHIREYHGRRTESRDTKAQIQWRHDNLHASDDQGSNPSRLIAHQHVALVVASPVGVRRDLTAPLDKPLNASERKALKDLVDNDFAALKQEIRRFASDATTAKRNEVMADWEAKGARKQEFLNRANDLRRTYAENVITLKAEADAAGIELTRLEGGGYTPQVTVKGLEEALRLVSNEIASEMDRALMTLERQRLTAQRQVLLAGITAEALNLLGEIPTAAQLMTEAALDRANKAVTAGPDQYDEYDD